MRILYPFLFAQSLHIRVLGPFMLFLFSSVQVFIGFRYGGPEMTGKKMEFQFWKTICECFFLHHYPAETPNDDSTRINFSMLRSKTPTFFFCFPKQSVSMSFEGYFYLP
ncbi:hypothetical protein XENOCAPTIV_028132 [Xenoophorus captivus]|uniref:Secreted protein n=1 Tax=Xenoophorus captivus TaxID=1517983 RepID=A0ABV0RAZ1_9TELE